MTGNFTICSADKILFGCSNEEEIRWAGNVACVEDRRVVYSVLVGTIRE